MYDGIHETMFMPGFKAHLQASLLEGNNFIPLCISLDLFIYPGYLLLFLCLYNHGSNFFILPLKDDIFVLLVLSVSSAFSTQA